MIRKFIRMILEAEESNVAEVQEINNLFQKIVDKFTQELAFTFAGPLALGFALAFGFLAIADNKKQAYINRYHADKDFRRFVNNGRIYRKDKFDISFLNTKAVNEYLKEELKAFDVLVYFNKKLRQISHDDLKRLLFIAKNYEQFFIMVKRIAKEV